MIGFWAEINTYALRIQLSDYLIIYLILNCLAQFLCVMPSFYEPKPFFVMKSLKIFLFAILPIIISCKHDEQLPSNHKIEFILLDSYETKTGSKAIIESSIVLNDSSLIEYSDITAYDPENHRFFLTSSSNQALAKMGSEKLHGRAFALAINREPVYTGYFWAAFSSSICDWVNVDPLSFASSNFLEVKLGYPWYSPEMQIPDNRNDQILLDILQQDGKLK